MFSSKLFNVSLFVSFCGALACGSGDDHGSSVAGDGFGDGPDGSGTYVDNGVDFGTDPGSACEGATYVRGHGEFDVVQCPTAEPAPEPVAEEPPVTEPPPAAVIPPTANVPPAEEPPAISPPTFAPPTVQTVPDAPPVEEPPTVDGPASEQPPAPEPPAEGVCDNPDGCDTTALPPECGLPPVPPAEPNPCKEGKVLVCHVPGHALKNYGKRFSLCVGEPAGDATPAGADHVGHGDTLGECVFE